MFVVSSRGFRAHALRSLFAGSCVGAMAALAASGGIALALVPFTASLVLLATMPDNPAARLKAVIRVTPLKLLEISANRPIFHPFQINGLGTVLQTVTGHLETKEPAPLPREPAQMGSKSLRAVVLKPTAITS